LHSCLVSSAASRAWHSVLSDGKRSLKTMCSVWICPTPICCNDNLTDLANYLVLWYIISPASKIFPNHRWFFLAKSLSCPEFTFPVFVFFFPCCNSKPTLFCSCARFRRAAFRIHRGGWRKNHAFCSHRNFILISINHTALITLYFIVYIMLSVVTLNNQPVKYMAIFMFQNVTNNNKDTFLTDFFFLSHFEIFRMPACLFRVNTH